eukprot:COSAG01_NODE_67640_length_266_cov_0.928144_1_plen_29_part_01
MDPRAVGYLYEVRASAECERVYGISPRGP